MIDQRTQGRIEGMRMILEYASNVEEIGPKYDHELTEQERAWWKANVSDAPMVFYPDSLYEMQTVIEWMIEREAMEDDE